MNQIKIVRTSTIPNSLNTFCKGLLKELLQEGYDVVAVSSPGEKLDELETREGVRTIAVPMERHISPFKDLKSLWKMIILFRKEKPDLVHSITPKAGLISMLAAKICGVPVRLHTFTGLVFPTSKGLKRNILIFTDRLTCACATHVVPEGEGVKKDLLNFRITNKPLKVLGYGNIRGIDLIHFNPKLQQVSMQAENLKKKGVFTFLFIGRLVRDKGINELVRAFSELNIKFPKTLLVLVGQQEKDLDPLLPETLKEIESNPAIEAVGVQKDVRPWLMAADAFVFPSYREGFPNVVIEAGAMGIPSIVTDINGSREIIIEGKNGTIIPVRDTQALIAAMEQAVVSENKKYSPTEIRELISSRYEQSYVRDCLKDYYKEILSRKS